MFGKHKKQKYVQLYNAACLLHAGPWYELPFTEEIIRAKSIAFFNDPCPCHIHQNAVRIRLLAELEAGYTRFYPEQLSQWFTLLAEYTGYAAITNIIFSEK